MGRFLASALLLSMAAWGADSSEALLAAAAAGSSYQAKALLEQGANMEATDRNGRTPLMLAAQHGHPEIVKLLLAAGAKPDARDHLGWTAYGLALLSPIGRTGHEEVLKTLPAPPRIHLAVDARWTPAGLQSSCFAPRAELPAAVGNLHLDTQLREAFLSFAVESGKGIIETVSEPSGPADAVAIFTVEPGAACGGNADNLTLSIDAQVIRLRDKEMLFQKTFGGGFKGLKKQTAANVAQYGPLFLPWTRSQAAPMYWAIVEALFRSKL